MEHKVREALLVGITAGVLILGSIVVLILRAFGSASPGSGASVRVYYGAELATTLQLPASGEITYRFDCPDGGYNILSLSPEGVRVTESDCPGGSCMLMGRTGDASSPIICLPHKLIVQVERADENGPDAISY